MRVPYRHLQQKRQLADGIITGLPTGSGFSGISAIASDASLKASSLILNSATTSAPEVTYNIASGRVTISSPATTTAAPTSSSVSASASASSDLSGGSTIAVGTVIGACVGAFAGFGLLLCIFFQFYKRAIKNAAKRSAGGDKWKKLGDGASGSSDNTRDMEEKHLGGMFKKSSPSIRTARTKFSDDDHGYDLPQVEFSKYHPHLAEELAVGYPKRPFAGEAAHRSDSGTSWDGSTMRDDSFLSMRSGRVDSGTISPTIGFAKTTPAAESSPVHRWESAEVLTMEEANAAGAHEVQNPFADVAEQRRSVGNPFFNAQEMQRTGTRSRSNSHASRTSRNRASTFSDARARQSERMSNPFADIQEVPVFRVAPPPPAHSHSASVASGQSGNMFGEHAMKSLIDALDLTQEEVEERLRAVSMHGSTFLRLSGVSGLDDDAEITTVREFPMPPADAHVKP
ncbi:hypothetical protein WOLCODRAFT_137910 [Wolfiporia cocos MD-104 SS10]|uniref:Uncharacterized protein n=1 Tax=Wolfiporia cocos (strain MD-104) TaxID=742152 RepID=A0A2H3JJS6_WOLCO|nr:hypothetical protein WOLCODRAFT_137910 [Wolfiporia cocos MD-104 SS10]